MILSDDEKDQNMGDERALVLLLQSTCLISLCCYLLLGKGLGTTEAHPAVGISVQSRIHCLNERLACVDKDRVLFARLMIVNDSCPI